MSVIMRLSVWNFWNHLPSYPRHQAHSPSDLPLLGRRVFSDLHANRASSQNAATVCPAGAIPSLHYGKIPAPPPPSTSPLPLKTNLLLLALSWLRMRRLRACLGFRFSHSFPVFAKKSLFGYSSSNLGVSGGAGDRFDSNQTMKRT